MLPACVCVCLLPLSGIVERGLSVGVLLSCVGLELYASPSCPLPALSLPLLPVSSSTLSIPYPFGGAAPQPRVTHWPMFGWTDVIALVCLAAGLAAYHKLPEPGGDYITVNDNFPDDLEFRVPVRAVPVASFLFPDDGFS